MNGSEQLKKMNAFFDSVEIKSEAGPINNVHFVHDLKKYVDISLIRIHDLDFSGQEFKNLLRNLRYIAINHNKK